MRRPNLRQLEVFLALMETRSVTETARRLSVSQPAISRALAELEAHLGAPLFHRQRGRLAPGTEALRLSADAKRLVAEAEAFRDSVEGLRFGRQGTLAVAAIPALASTIVAHAAGRLVAAEPQARLEVLSEISGRVVQEVAWHRVELGFAHGPIQDRTVHHELLGESEIVCAMRADHPLAKRAQLAPRDLKGEPLVFLDGFSPPVHLVRETFDRARLVPNVAIETNMALAAKEAALAGNRIALIDPMVMMIDRSPRLVLRAFRPRVPLRILGLYPRDRPLSRLAQRYLDDVRALIAEFAKDNAFLRARGA